MGGLIGGLILLFFICCGLFPVIEFTIGLIIIFVGAIFALAGLYIIFDDDIGAGILLLLIGIIIIFVGIMFL